MMSAPTEDRGQQKPRPRDAGLPNLPPPPPSPLPHEHWHPRLGDLRLWYPTFEVYAASAGAHNPYFHGPHVGSPVDLDRVWLGIQWFQDRYGDGASGLPALDEMNAELRVRGHGGGGPGVADEGSPCHNFWHWIHGE